MKYFDYIDETNLDRIFLKRPYEFNKNTDKDKLKYSLGAFLYIPATQYDMIYKAIRGEVKGVKNIAICLEDAIGEKGEEESINNLKQVFKNIKTDTDIHAIPLIFIRMRNVDQFKKIKDIFNKNKDIITGILIPKANSKLIEEYIDILNSIQLNNMYIMPIIESKEFIDVETKKKSFEDLYETLLKHKDRILNIRIGVTDILGLYGVRRSKYFSIYDNLICAEFIRDMILYLNKEELDIPISGGVSELFNIKNEQIKNKYIEEVMLDIFNGFIGKTVIHPLQILITQALYIVRYEDYMDAKSILDNVDCKYGVSKGISGERMNEIKPHLFWAKKIMTLSEIYGVLNEEIDYNELLEF